MVFDFFRYKKVKLKFFLASVTSSVLGGSDGKESTRIAGEPGSILGLRRSLGEGNGYPL